MTMEDLIRATIKVVEAWEEVGRQLKEAADAIYELFSAAFSCPDRRPEKHDTPPQKRKMSVRQMASHYNYIPKVPRNLPYMRRAY